MQADFEDGLHGCVYLGKEHPPVNKKSMAGFFKFCRAAMVKDMIKLEIADPNNSERMMTTDADFLNLWKIRMIKDENDPTVKYLPNKYDIRKFLSLRNPFGKDILIKLGENNKIITIDPNGRSLVTRTNI